MEEGNLSIRPLHAEDWPAVRRIYQQGIDTGVATFETKIPEWETWSQKYHPFCRLVATLQDQVVGWAVLSPVSKRPVYRGVAEVSIYIDPAVHRKGVGSQLFRQLFTESEENGIWTLQSGIFAENEPSIRLHRKMGFKLVGYRDKIGQLNGEWKDHVLMERRSAFIY